MTINVTFPILTRFQVGRNSLFSYLPGRVSYIIAANATIAQLRYQYLPYQSTILTTGHPKSIAIYCLTEPLNDREIQTSQHRVVVLKFRSLSVQNVFLSLHSLILSVATQWLHEQTFISIELVNV